MNISLVEAEFTRMAKWLIIHHTKSFKKFINFLLIQNISKWSDFIRESGDIFCVLSSWLLSTGFCVAALTCSMLDINWSFTLIQKHYHCTPLTNMSLYRLTPQHPNCDWLPKSLRPKPNLCYLIFCELYSATLFSARSAVQEIAVTCTRNVQPITFHMPAVWEIQCCMSCIPSSTAQNWTRLRFLSSSGCNVTIPSEVIILNSIVLPHKDLNRGFKNQIIL